MSDNYRNYTGKYSNNQNNDVRQYKSITSYFNRSGTSRAHNYDSQRGLQLGSPSSNANENINESTSNYNNNNRAGMNHKENKNKRMQPNPTQSEDRIEQKLDIMMKSWDDKFFSTLSQIGNQTNAIEQKTNRAFEILSSHDKQLNDLNQMRLANKMEIQGLLSCVDTNDDELKDMVMSYFDKLGIKTQPHEIFHIYSYEKKIREETKLVINVIFCHEAVKKKVMKIKFAAKSNDGVYFSDCLTRYNAGLLMHGKSLQKEGKIFKAFFMGLSVYIVKQEGEGKIKVDDHDILQQIGDSVVTSQTHRLPRDPPQKNVLTQEALSQSSVQPQTLHNSLTSHHQ